MTPTLREARDDIIAALEPLAPIHRLRVMAAVATMLGHYELAAGLLIRAAVAKNSSADRPGARARVVSAGQQQRESNAKDKT